jgi:putative ABC transport system permease protein
MNIVNKLTLRSLKQNKRRTLVTIMGVIISVAMITAVATLTVSFLEMMKKQTIAEDGNWHVAYSNVNETQLEAIKKDTATKTVVTSRDVGYAHLEGSQNQNKPYLFIKQFNEAGFEHFPIKLIEGRLPAAPNEIVISEQIAANAKVELPIGSTLSLEVGQRMNVETIEGIEPYDQQYSLMKDAGKLEEKLVIDGQRNYTIVGVIERPNWEPTWAPGYTAISYLDDSSISQEKSVQAFVILHKVKSSLYEHAKVLASEIGLDADSVRYNNGLLRYYGITSNDNLRSAMYGLAVIITTIIMVGSVSLIYNAFAISVSERSRYLGMLSSVGATKRQKRNSVFFEGAIIGAVSIPTGLIAGLLGMWITFKFLNTTIQGALGMTETLTVVVTPMMLVTACLVSIVTIFISTYIPAKRASQVSAIDAIRQATEIKLTGKKVRTSKLVRKLFGMEGEIALKNLKRNKRKYQATVFSLVISIVLFLSVTYFTDSLKKSVELTQDGLQFDITLRIDGDANSQADTIETIASLDTVQSYSVMKDIWMEAWISEEQAADPLKKMAESSSDLLKDGKYRYQILVHALDDQSLQAYARYVGVDWETLINRDAPAAIVVDTTQYQDAQAKKYVEAKAIHTAVGNKLELHSYDNSSEKVVPVGEVSIAALTEKLPMGAFSSGMGGLNIVVSDRIIDLFYKDSIDKMPSGMYILSNDPMKTQDEIENLRSDLNLFNYYLNRQQEQQMLLIMSVFTYGFILLITGISIANIFNTISTSIALRKREFAMLKSIGMTPKGFNRMINYESIFYGMKALLYGIPISIASMYLIYYTLMDTFDFSFKLAWLPFGVVVAAVFFIVITAMLYSSSKVKRENIIDALKQENL